MSLFVTWRRPGEAGRLALARLEMLGADMHEPVTLAPSCIAMIQASSARAWRASRKGGCARACRSGPRGSISWTPLCRTVVCMTGSSSVPVGNRQTHVARTVHIVRYFCFHPQGAIQVRKKCRKIRVSRLANDGPKPPVKSIVEVESKACDLLICCVEQVLYYGRQVHFYQERQSHAGAGPGNC